MIVKEPLSPWTLVQAWDENTGLEFVLNGKPMSPEALRLWRLISRIELAWSGAISAEAEAIAGPIPLLKLIHIVNATMRMRASRN